MSHLDSKPVPANILHLIEPGELPRGSQWKGKLVYGTPHFKEMYKLIGENCRMIEHVQLSKPDWHMFVDEDGLRKKLPFNIVASQLAGQTIVGTALIWEGDME